MRVGRMNEMLEVLQSLSVWAKVLGNRKALRFLECSMVKARNCSLSIYFILPSHPCWMRFLELGYQR